MKYFTKQQREAKAVRDDMQKVFKIIHDAKTRYIKAKLKAKSKKQAEDAAALFADLKDYGSKQEIQDYYGGGWITNSECERLINLWDMREQHAKNGAMYRDRVIEMLDKAISHIGEDYQELLEEADEMTRENKKNQKEIINYKRNG